MTSQLYLWDARTEANQVLAQVAGGMATQTPPAAADAMQRGYAAVMVARLVEQSLKVGALAPDSRLINATGTDVNLAGLLIRRDGIVVGACVELARTNRAEPCPSRPDARAGRRRRTGTHRPIHPAVLTGVGPLGNDFRPAAFVPGGGADGPPCPLMASCRF